MLIRIALLLVLAAALATAQIPIPKSRLGFPFGGCYSTAQIQWEAFLDINCPDCQAAFPTLIQVAQNYSSEKLCLTAYMFPLPYHRNSFAGSQGAFIVDEATKGKGTYAWFKLVYDNLKTFDPYSTYDQDPNDIFEKYAELATNLGISKDTFVSAVKADESNLQAREHFKFGCSRGVAGTPTFFVNGVNVAADSTWTTEMWTKLFNELLK